MADSPSSRTRWYLLATPFVLLAGVLIAPVLVGASQPPPAAEQTPFSQASTVLDGLSEIRVAFIRLPLAALFGTALAFRPRRQTQGARKVVVMQTQIMLAVVGAVIMLVVGNSLSRAFGIVGAAGLIRYRSNIADPKDAVVMLCALASGLSVGVGLYQVGAVATAFMMLLLWLIEFLEPPARRRFELRIDVTDPEFRAKAEGVLKGLSLEFELLLEDDEQLRYSISAPVNVHTRDVSDTLRLVAGSPIVVRWEERKPNL